MNAFRPIGLRQQLSRISPLTAGIILLFAAAMTYFIFRAFAASGTATLYTSPGGTQSVSTGQTFAVSVRVSSGASVPVTGAAVYLAYPTSKLQVISESYGGPYNTQLVATDSGGILRMDRAAFPMISGGDQLFAQVTFKAITSGSAPLSFTGSSIVTSGEDDSNILAQKNDVTYNITTPATPPPASSGGGSSSGSGSSSSASKAGTGGSSKTTTTQSGGSQTSSGSGSSASSGTPQSSTPGSSQSTQVTDQSAGTVESSLEITVVDSKNKPVEGATVTVNGQTAKTDKNGVARFSGVAAGDQTIAVSYNGKKTSKVIQVKGASTQASPQTFKVSVVRNKFNPVLLFIPILVLLAAGGFIMRPWERFAKSTADAPADQVVTSNQPPEATQATTHNKQETPGTVYSPDESNGPDSQPPNKNAS